MRDSISTRTIKIQVSLVSKTRGQGPCDTFAGAIRALQRSRRPPAVHLDTPTRPRIVLLAGSSTGLFGETDTAAGLFDAVLRGLAGLNLEVLAIAGGRAHAFLEPLSANLRVIDPTPLHVLLPTCDLVIHQGGGGTRGDLAVLRCAAIAVADVGRPRLECPAAPRSGAGRWLAAESVTAEAIRDHVERLLTTEAIATMHCGCEQRWRPSHPRPGLWTRSNASW